MNIKEMVEKERDVIEEKIYDILYEEGIIPYDNEFFSFKMWLDCLSDYKLGKYIGKEENVLVIFKKLWYAYIRSFEYYKKRHYGDGYGFVPDPSIEWLVD